MLPIDRLRSGVRTTLLIVTVAALLFVGTACGGSSDDASTETTVAAPPVETSSTSLARTTTTKTNPFTAVKATSSTLTTGSSTADASPGASDPASPVSSPPNGHSNGDDPSATSQPATQTTTRVTTTQQITTTTQATTATSRATTTTAVKPTTTTTAKAAVVLTVVGPSGTKQFSMADLKAMPAVSGYGGWKNQLGNITAPVAWKGVSIKALMDLVGGAGSVGVIASDGYTATLSAAELSGQTNLYDPSTGNAVSQISGSLRVIVAYAKNGSAISSGEGPLRIAFVSPQKDQVTDSDQWVKKVTEMRAE